MDLVRLDLHGIRHEDAKREVVRFIEAHWDSGNELEIITGHSTRMKGIVMNTLEEYDLTYNLGRIFEGDAARIITWL